MYHIQWQRYEDDKDTTPTLKEFIMVDTLTQQGSMSGTEQAINTFVILI